MAAKDVFDSFAEVLARQASNESPWRIDGDLPRYMPDYALLEALLAIPIADESTSESGRLANAIDAWVAAELRRAGFESNEVWPRLQRPRVLPRELGLFVHSLPKTLRAKVEPYLLSRPAVAPRDAKILGRAYSKQVDVVVAQWSRGPEVMISTKSMVSSFGNNLKNRFEESYGDAKNLRARFPLAAIGFLFVFRSTILDTPAKFEKAVDMMRKLRAESDVYDSTCIVLAQWDDSRLASGVQVLVDSTPQDLRADSFLADITSAVIERTPIEMHVEVRQRRAHQELAVQEGVDPSEE